MTELRELTVWAAHFSSFRVFEHLRHLERLAIHGGSVRDPSLEPLRQCASLRNVEIRFDGPDNPLPDFEALGDLASLTRIEIPFAAVGMKAIDAMRARRPDIDIRKP